MVEEQGWKILNEIRCFPLRGSRNCSTKGKMREDKSATCTWHRGVGKNGGGGSIGLIVNSRRIRCSSEFSATANEYRVHC